MYSRVMDKHSAHIHHTFYRHMHSNVETYTLTHIYKCSLYFTKIIAVSMNQIKTKLCIPTHITFKGRSNKYLLSFLDK